MKSKTKTNQSTTASYGWQTPPTTQAQQTFDEAIGQTYNAPDATIGYTAAKAEQNLKDRFDNPWGYNYSPEVKEASLQAGQEEINLARGVALRADSEARKAGKLQALGISAAARAPQLVQTGGTMQGTQTQTQPWGPLLIGAAGNIGAAAVG